MLGPVSGADETPARQILVLQSLNRGNLVLDHFTGGLRIEMDERAGEPLNVVQIVVGTTGSVGAPEQAVVDFIRSTYAGRPPPELILTIAGPAAVFARKHRAQLFPDTPILFSAVDYRYLQGTPQGENEAAISAINDFPGLIDDVLQLLPETRQVFVVLGSGSLGQFWHERLERDFKRFQDRVSFAWSSDLSLAEMLSRCANLPKNSAIFYLTFGTDASGTAYADERVVAELRVHANAPLFAVQSPYMGSGIVGGRLVDMDELARNTADAAIRILNGTPSSGIGFVTRRAGRAVFDWRELQRWGVSESRLPTGSEVLFRRPSLWVEYRTAVLVAAGALAVQALLIIGLLLERRARRRAEIESRKNLTLAADATRRVTMSALTGSIAHELSQPISAMIFNAEALQLMLKANRATPEDIADILSDIQGDGILAVQIIERQRSMLRSREIEKKPIDLQAIVHDTLALVAHDVRERQVKVMIDLASNDRVIHGDAILLEQVLVNLVMNAMDAMAEIPQEQRLITISSEFRRSDVDISVRDTGPGLPANLIGKVFTPFVTTKSQGLGIGLAIARNIVQAHGGNIAARNNSGKGATFTVTLPVGEATRVPSVAHEVVGVVSESPVA
jgi:signal transduction histidine kinase